MALLRRVCYGIGEAVSVVAMLPWPWHLRILWYSLVDHAVQFALGFLPQVYEMLAEDGVRYGMGKRRTGHAQSIKVMELVVQELAHSNADPVAVRDAYIKLQSQGTFLDDFPYRLADMLLDPATRKRLLRRVRAL